MESVRDPIGRAGLDGPVGGIMHSRPDREWFILILFSFFFFSFFFSFDLDFYFNEILYIYIFFLIFAIIRRDHSWMEK